MLHRRLIVPLLLLCFLHGVHARASAPALPGQGHAQAVTVLSDRAVPVVQASLPGLSGWLAAELSVAPAGYRTARTMRHSADPLSEDASPALAARSRAVHSEIDFLARARTVLRARANLPTTYGNPPPASLS